MPGNTQWGVGRNKAMSLLAACKNRVELFAQWAALCDPFQVGRVRSWRSCVSALSAVSELDQELLYVCHPSYTTPP